MGPMTTTCLPCEMAAAEADVEETPEGRTAEWSGPIGIENQRTGDGRRIESNALRWDTLPVPLRWAMQDFGAHDGAYVVGKIEEVERLTYDEANERLTGTGRDPLPESFSDAVIIWGSGTHDLGSEHGREAHRQVKEGLTPGISMDLDDIVVKEEDEEGFLSILEGRVRAATQVAIPAFEGARISVSDAGREVFDADARLADAESLVDADGSFNWVEDAGGLPKYIKRIEKHLREKGMDESRAIATAVNVVKRMCATGDLNFPGSQQVNAGSRAEACAAVAEWEKKKASHQGESVTASAAPGAFPREWFDDPRLEGPTGFTVTDEGRVYGHIALWGTCHTASPQGRHVCTQPPRSPSNYARFHTGVVPTTEGDLACGRVTMNTLHAGQRLSANDSIYHYEHTGAVGAFVRAGQDAHGIWVAGAAHPSADRLALKAAPISGDWRTFGGQLDLVAALSVNVPGFPVPRATALVAGGAVRSLVASGVVSAGERSEGMRFLGLDDDETVMALRARFREMDRRERADALRVRVERLAALERVRRVARAVGFAYNKDQWRVPKGNPEGGRWVDMPDAGVADLSRLLESVFEDPKVSGDGDKAAALGEALDQASEAAGDATAALRGGDGDAAKEAAARADESLSKVEAQLQDLADSGALDEGTAGQVGEALDNAREGVSRVKDSDLSLLGDEGIGEDEGGDIGGDAKPGDAPGDIGGADAGHPAGAPSPADSPEGEGAAPAVAGALAEAGLDPAVVDRVSKTGWIQDPNDMSGTGDDGADSAWDVLNALPEGTEIVTGQEPLNVDWVKDPSTAGGWRVTEVGPGVDPADGYEVGGGMQGDPASLDGGGDNDIYIKDATPVSEGKGTPSPPGAATDAPGTPPGSAQQQAAAKAGESASKLEGVLQDAADGGMDEGVAAQVGEALDSFRDDLDRLTGGVRDGAYDADDLSKAKDSLSQLEAVLMGAADMPGGMSDEDANGIGVALDDVFADLGALAQSLQGEAEPPPFATRRYVRQWLGRRGIRLGQFARRG